MHETRKILKGSGNLLEFAPFPGDETGDRRVLSQFLDRVEIFSEILLIQRVDRVVAPLADGHRLVHLFAREVLFEPLVRMHGPRDQMVPAAGFFNAAQNARHFIALKTVS
jgi:hypothetical protein